MATSKLEVFNRALDIIGVRRLESLTIDRDARYALDDAYAFVLQLCLEQGNWAFAMRTVAPTGTSLPTLDYGLTNAFTRPLDCVHTYLLGDSKNFSPPLADAVEADGYYLARTTPIYARYVSNDASFGGLLTRWTNVFAHYFAAELAAYVAYQLTRSEKMATMAMQVAALRLSQARATDSMLASVGLMPYNALARRELIAGGNIAEILNPFPAAQPSQQGET